MSTWRLAPSAKGLGALLSLAFLGAVPAGAAVFCVDDDYTSGPQDGTSLRPFRTVQAAIDAAASGDELRVAAGTYAENLVVNTKALTLLGGFVGGTTAGYLAGNPGDFTTRDPLAHVSTLEGDDTTAVLRFLRYGAVSGPTRVDGMRITGGRRGIHWDTTYPSGEFENFWITGNVIEDNGLYDAGLPLRGGGLAINGTDFKILDNVIRGNSADQGAGIGGSAHGLLLSDNVIENNISFGDHGGGLWLGGDGTIDGNVVRGNRIGEVAGYGWGGGMLVVGTWTISGNLIVDNTAPSLGGGVFVDEGAVAQIEHNRIVGNHTLVAWVKGGAGVYVDGAGAENHSRAYIRHCTIADNTSPGTAGGNGVFVEHSDVWVTDSIFWGNSFGDDFYTNPDRPSTLTVTYTLSQEPVAGAGNFSADPRFANAAGDYHLRSTGGRWDPAALAWVQDSEDSPGIDAANPLSPYALETQPNGGRANLGAYGNTVEASRSHGDLIFKDGFQSP